ncbi:ArpU family phage packaging/lysis transcriptional regulator [Aerococcus christensenii]|uniref:ArpU family phage packaging/lysis transcriptional regulator n=1 Tax=Aerococcus christensenii TaxID=87541 RepID=UPI003F41E51A
MDNQCVKGRLYVFLEINKNRKVKNVDDLLSSYGRLCRLSGISQQKMVATFSAEPFVPSADNTNEKKLIKAIDYQAQIEKVNQAIQLLGRDHQQLLIDKYLKEYKDYWIYSKYSMSRSTYYRELEDAKLFFAEAYDKGSLLVYI